MVRARSGSRRWPGQSVWIFLGRRRLAAKPRFIAIGFPWILSFESRLINGLRGINREKFFLVLSSRSNRGDRRTRPWQADRQRYSWGKHSRISDFLKGTAVRGFNHGCAPDVVDVRSRRSCTAPRSASRTIAAKRPPTSPASSCVSRRRNFWSVRSGHGNSSGRLTNPRGISPLPRSARA
jgi:hypothetical protein